MLSSCKLLRKSIWVSCIATKYDVLSELLDDIIKSTKNSTDRDLFNSYAIVIIS